MGRETTPRGHRCEVCDDPAKFGRDGEYFCSFACEEEQTDAWWSNLL